MVRYKVHRDNWVSSIRKPQAGYPTKVLNTDYPLLANLSRLSYKGRSSRLTILHQETSSWLSYKGAEVDYPPVGKPAGYPTKELRVTILQ